MSNADVEMILFTPDPFQKSSFSWIRLFSNINKNRQAGLNGFIKWIRRAVIHCFEIIFAGWQFHMMDFRRKSNVLRV